MSRPFQLEVAAPALVINGERIEGPLYQSRTGIGDMALAAGEDAHILAMAFIGSGRYAPPKITEQLKGMPLGSTITIRIAETF